MSDEPFVSDYQLQHKYDYEDVLVDAITRSSLSMVSYDNYTQCYNRNKEYGLDMYFDNLRIYSNVAKRCGVSLWTTLLSVGHWSYRIPSEDDLRWQISTAVAHGVNAILWFYLYARELEDDFRGSPFDLFYRKTATYENMVRQNNIFNQYYAKYFISFLIFGREWCIISSE